MLPRHRIGKLFGALILADGNILHFGRDDAAARVVHLGHVRAGLCASRRALQVEAHLRECRILQAHASEDR